ncbi:hypothetical protein JTB14_003263 [Gonioctena quinquepunctata]|nr:hypothetical protein JTB14_003263 [Gonioctena quinquepunctata]
MDASTRSLAEYDFRYSNIIRSECKSRDELRMNILTTVGCSFCNGSEYFTIIGKDGKMNDAYTDSEIPTKGTTSVNVEAFDEELICPLYVVESDDIPLFGLDWYQAFQLELPPGSTSCQTSNSGDKYFYEQQPEELHQNQCINQKNDSNIEKLLSTYKELFHGGLRDGGSFHEDSHQ